MDKEESDSREARGANVELSPTPSQLKNAKIKKKAENSNSKLKSEFMKHDSFALAIAKFYPAKTSWFLIDI